MDFPETDTFRGRRVFLTGHTGFKGSWLALWLSRLGAEVTGYSLQPPTEVNHFDLAGVREHLVEDVRGDLRDGERIAAAMRRSRPDLVMHLAAQSVVRTGYERPRETFDVNVMGSIGVMEAVRGLDDPPAVLMVTSDKCYENVEQVWGYRENDAMGEHDPYGGSKGAAELAIRSYRCSFFPPDRIDHHGVRLASARAGNVIGGGDWKPHALIVDVVKALLADETVVLRNPSALRPWQHVLQCLSGYLTLADKLLSPSAADHCGGWNVGPLPGGEITVREVVQIFHECFGSGRAIERPDPSAPPEAGILRLAIDKAIWQLPWHPCLTTSEAIEATAKWYAGYRDDPASVADLSLEQIHWYEQQMARWRSESDPSTSPVASA